MTYEDVLKITRDSTTFITSIQNVVPHVPRSSRRPPLHFDPPEHDAYREVIDPVLRKSVVRNHEHDFRQSAEELVAKLLKSENPEYCKDFAMPFVAQCFATFLGVSADLTLRVREIGIGYSHAIQDMDEEAIALASAELYDIAERIYRDRLTAGADPDTDLAAGLHRATMDSKNHITELSAIATIRQMIVAGMGAPQAVLGSCIVHLAQDPELQDHLRAHPEDLPAALEEFLRLYAPYRVFARTARKDVRLADKVVRAGEPIALIFPSANRDESVFENPDTFMLNRPANRHLAFGRGAHRCPAATMGKVEMRIALETLLASTTAFSLSGEVKMMNWLEYGPRSVPLHIVASEVFSPQTGD